MKKLSKLLVTVLFCLSVAFVSVTPAFAATAKVKNLKASVTASKVILSWSKASGVSGYQIQQYVKEKWKAVATTTKTTYTVKKLTTGTTYKFRVRAFKKSGKKTVYGKASSAVSAKPVCIAPTSFKASVLSPTSVKFTWKAVPAASGYKLQKYNGKKWVDVSKTTATSLTVSKLSTGVTVKFRVLAYKTVGKKLVNGKVSATLSVTPSIKIPGSVKVTAASPVSANISWSAVPGVSGYLIYKYDDTSKKWTYAAMTGRTTCTVKNLIPSVSNQLRVRGYVKNGDKTVYGAFSKAVAFKTTAIAAPTSLTLKGSDSTTATLSWNAVSGVTGYAVYIWNSAENKWQWSLTCSGTECTVKNLPTNSDFTLAVKAYIKAANGKNYLSANSNSVSGHTSPAAVTDLKAVNLTDKSFTLSWTASKDASIIERYEIYAQITRTNENGDRVSKFEYISSVPSGTTTFNVESLDDKPLEQKTPYVFRVIGYSFFTKTNAAGKPVTNRLYATPAEAVITTALSDVKDFRAENPTSSSVNLSWSVNTRAESYKLQLKKEGATEWTDVDLSKCDKVDKGTAVVSYTVKELEPSTVYTFRVTAVSGNITSVGANEISSKTAPKSDAVLEKGGVTPSSITIKWNAVAGADGYELQWVQPGKEDWEALTETDKTTITVNNLAQCTAYKFRMRSYYTKADGSKVYAEKFSNELSETTLLNTISLAFRTDAGMTGSSSISVAWIANSRATSYKLFYKEGAKNSSSEWKEIEATITNKDNITSDNVCVYKLTGLKPSTKYSFKGIAVCGEVRSTESEVVEGMTAPAKVTGVKADCSDTSAKLTWQTSRSVSKYVVEIKVADKWLSSATAEGEKYLTVYSSGYCNVKNLDQFTKYSFRVAALYDTDSSLLSSKYITSDYSDEVEATTKLSAVKNLRFVSATETSITLSWTPNEKTNEYVVKYGDSSASVGNLSNGKVTTKDGICTVTVSGLTASNKTVFFTVAAKSGTSVGLSSSTSGKTAPSTVSKLEVKDTTRTSAQFNITCASGADGYIAYDKNGNALGELVGGTTLNGLEPGETYEVKVKAFNTVGSTKILSAGFSSVVTLSTKIDAPTGVSATKNADGKTVVITWNGVSGAEKYNVYRGNEKVGSLVTGTTFTDGKTQPGTTYTYTVEAVKGSFTSARSAASNSVTTNIENVTNVTATAKSSSSITLSWKAVNGAKSYKIFDEKGTEIASVTGTSYDVKNLSGYTEYTFKVQAVVNDEVKSDAVESNKARTKVAPVSVKLVKRTADKITLSWDKANGAAEGYLIYVDGKQVSFDKAGNTYSITVNGAKAVKIEVVVYIGTEKSEAASIQVPAFQSAQAA